ncbi:type II secretion system protein J (GspJ) [Luteibacter rhizovicinus]|uniref:Type II secretion system protein J (GspJ) n=1 Tax=Luteibacter rhizovicinus TaxID=242606 RepID=A0A4R3YIY5_9GAMM|nr:prepilin-type N-terminal cleavage/methylation domain-containing protein [Luteibacter rhizovicinus]TCV92012.1 type II secretion system protein J (GspJ) [Luteibacter rhizovicinus]
MKRARGFSLMEVLAALALLTIVLLGVYSGVRTASRIVRSGDAAIERMDAIRSTQGFLRAELAQALNIGFDRNDDGDPIVFNGDAKTLRFVAPLPGYLGKLGPQLQTISLVDDGHRTLRLEASFALLPPDGGEPKTVGEPEVLLRGIRSGGFAYRGMDDQNQPGDWQETWPDGRRTPSLVRVTLMLNGGTAWPTMDAPLRIDPSATGGPNSLSRGLRGQVIR